MIKSIYYERDSLFLIDQRLLPGQLKIVQLNNITEIEKAIKEMMVRGAPAIGITGAYGIVIGQKNYINSDTETFFQKLEENYKTLVNTRPTAINLKWALDRVKSIARKNKDKPIKEIWELMLKEAKKIHNEEIDRCRKISKNGAKLIPQRANILTHCNTGPLATGGIGTALGSIIQAHKNGKEILVFVDETRPLLQGARLTTWELEQENIPHTLITDNIAGFLISRKKIDLILVGADRIAKNGDTANKIGTYSLAILANYHNIPFYVAAPFSTIDTTIDDGSKIPIEYRDPAEVTNFNGIKITHNRCNAISPAFDVTPSELISAIITDKGIFRYPYSF